MSDEVTQVPPLGEDVHEVADRIVRRYPVARSALLPLLHLVQSVQNHITDAGIAFCAEKVGLTRAEVGAVATFYTMYKRQPVGDWLLSVCTNPACKQAGGQEIYENYVAALGGHSDPETGVTVEHAECLGICDGAPVVQVNYEMFGPMTVAEGDQLLASCRRGDPPVSPWSGEKPPTFAEVERDLSGANDAWEPHLHRAALQQVAHESPPTYRTGETDIPVTHPGGDPAGVGGALFREAASSDGERAGADVPTDPAEAPAPSDVVVGDQPGVEHTATPLDGSGAQRIAPGESDDTDIAAAGPGAPTEEEVDVHAPSPHPYEGDAPALSEGLTLEEAPDGADDSQTSAQGDQSHEPVSGDTARGDDGAVVSGYADDPDRDAEDAAGVAGDTEDTEGREPSDETDVAPGEADASAQSAGVGDPEGEPEADGVLPHDAKKGEGHQGDDEGHS